MAAFKNTNDDGCWDLIRAAEYHGGLDDPDHEVGDLQDVVVAAWGLLSKKQRTKLLSDCEDLGNYHPCPECLNIEPEPTEPCSECGDDG